MGNLKHIITAHKRITAIAAAFVLLCSAVIAAVAINNNARNNKIDSIGSASDIVDSSSMPESETESSDSSTQEIPSEEEKHTENSMVSSESTVSSKAPSNASSTASKTPAKTSSKAPAKTPAKTPAATGDYKYNTNTDIENNIFLDALVYTGYNLKKHRSDGLMWQYVLASQKRGKGWLSKIGYGGGSSGYETTGGKPNIKYFESHGLVCASYVTYVYFNYLPNVAGIDTSSLTKPVKSYSADSWYKAAMDWVSKGYSKTISFTASDSASGIVFKPASTIPIGSIIVFSDKTKPGSTVGSHVAIYAGYKNGYHWVTHVGNSNGPEFCAVERMKFGPDPQWPLKVITTPSNIRMSALLEVTVKDDSGTPLSGVGFSLKSSKTGAVKKLGTTNKNGILSVSDLDYGDYTLIQTVPSGYTSSKSSIAIKLTAANNSYNKVSVTDNKIIVSVPEETTESSVFESSSAEAVQ